MTVEEKKKNTPTIILGVLLIVVLAAVAFFAFASKGSNDAADPDFPPIVVPTPDPDAPTVTANIAVNYRRGPSVNYASYGIAPAGSRGEAIGISEDGAWWVVKLPISIAAEGQGWVSAEYVTAVNTDGLPVIPSPELPPDIDVPTPDPNMPSVTALDVLNVRSGPGTNYASYGHAPTGTKGEVVGVSEDGDWWVVKIPVELVPVGQGWVSADWVLFENPNDVEIPVIPAP